MKIPGILTILILNILPVNGYGQYTMTMKYQVPTREGIKTTNSSLLLISPEFSMTGVVIKIDTSASFTNSFIIAENDTIFLKANEHSTDTSSYLSSNLIVFKNKLSEFRFYPSAIDKEVEFLFINASPSKKVLRKAGRKKKDAGCSEPGMIDQEIWREGLPEPDYERIVHKVKNIIVHHSATSNDLTDYTNVIRNIYLYHTEGNGWSDIGYNYVIAQDGTIFKGRDPGIYEQDNVMGAHFCSSNSGTMGICILGNYMDTSPTSESLNYLEDLLSWKAAKDTLNPYGICGHPLNPDLNIIAGHREGCSTLCPGDSLYYMLDSIRKETAGKLESCGFLYSRVITDDWLMPQVEIFQNPGHANVSIKTKNISVNKMYLADLNGKLIMVNSIIKIDDNHLTFNTDQIIPGMYFIIFVTDKKIFTEKMIIY